MDVPGGDGGAPVEEPGTGTVEEGGGDGGEAGGQGEEDDSDKNDETTQRILNIMANFLEGEVVLILVLIICSEHLHVSCNIFLIICIYVQ